jgi:hypothetical protein
VVVWLLMVQSTRPYPICASFSSGRNVGRFPVRLCSKPYPTSVAVFHLPPHSTVRARTQALVGRCDRQAVGAEAHQLRRGEDQSNYLMHDGYSVRQPGHQVAKSTEARSETVNSPVIRL